LTSQEIFEIVCVHLLTQNQKSQETPLGGRCKYRGYGNKKCAIGILISDNLYDPAMEFQSVSYVGSMFPETKFSDHIPLLEDLQLMHDTLEPYQWKNELYLIASENKLSPIILNHFPYF
jgi:hypothetical protein